MEFFTKNIAHIILRVYNITKDTLPSYPGYEKTNRKVPIGLDTDTLQMYYLSMEQTPAFVSEIQKQAKQM